MKLKLQLGMDISAKDREIITSNIKLEQRAGTFSVHAWRLPKRFHITFVGFYPALKEVLVFVTRY